MAHTFREEQAWKTFPRWQETCTLMGGLVRLNNRPEQVVGFFGVPLEKMLRAGVFVACRLAGAELPAFLPLSTRGEVRPVERGKQRPEATRKAPDRP